MAVDDKARLALEKGIVQEKKKEADLQKKINKMVADGADQRKKAFKNTVKDLETQKELTLQAKNRLKDHNKFISLEKTYAKSLATSTKLTKEVLDTNIQTDAHEKLKEKSGFKQKEVLESIVNQRNKMIGLSTEQQMLDYDHQTTIDEIKDLLSDTTDMSEGEVKYLQSQLDYNESIAKSLNKQSAATQMSAEAQEGVLGALGTSKDAMKGIVAGARQFLAAMLANPVTAIVAGLLMLVTLVIKAAKHVRQVSEDFGVGYVNAGKLAFEMAKVNPALRAAGVEVDALGKSLFDTFKTMSAVTTENMNKLGFLNLKFGVTSDTAAGLAQIVQRELGGSIGENIDRVSEFAKEFDVAGVSAEKALSDMVENSKMLYDFMGGSVDQFIKATIHAHKLGLSLDTVASIADSLLDFESSIESTMQASLLIGRQLNFDRARGLALEGDTLGAVQDITKQLGGVAEFQKLNVLQRRGLAEALGVGTDELSALIRGEAVEMKGDPVIKSQGKLIEAINSNTVAQKGEDFLQSRQDNKKAAEEAAKQTELMTQFVQKSDQQVKNTGVVANAIKQ